MRKYVVWAFCFAMIITLLSCGGADNKNNLDISYSLEPSNDIPAVSNTNADIAMEIYVAVLKNEIKVFETDIEEYNYLKDCKTPYDRVPLCEMEGLEYNYLDVDGDSINELVIDCGDTLILRYYEGCVYVYPFTLRGINNFHTDGSYSWNDTGVNFEYGEDQLSFDGAELRTKELWRIVNDGEPNAEYYIDGKQVTQEEILKYIEDNPKTRIEFSPLEASWLNKVSRYQAITIAKKYWEHFDIEENGYRVEHAVNANSPDSVYVVVIKRFVIDHYSVFDEIWIDKNTGETIIPYASDGKGGDDELTNSYPVTEDQAWSLANTYWDCQDGSKDYGAGTIWSAKIVVSDTPSSDDKYYKVDFLIEWISNVGSDGDDGTTPYAVHAKDRILINAFTGEITTPACEAGNKCISVEEAIEIVENHCKDADLDNGKNVYRGKLDVNVSAPDHIYVIVIKTFVDNYYAYDTEYWIDKYTGKIFTPYYMYGKG